MRGRGGVRSVSQGERRASWVVFPLDALRVCVRCVFALPPPCRIPARARWGRRSFHCFVQ